MGASRGGSLLRHGNINQAVRAHRKRQKPERALMKAPKGRGKGLRKNTGLREFK
jgi:hypothetical protein